MCREAKLASETIAVSWVFSSGDIQAAPKHSVLSGEDREVRQGVELISPREGTSGEPCRDLVGPLLFGPSIA